MKTFKLIGVIAAGISFLVSLSAMAASDPQLKPEFKHVPLKEFTTLSLDILPNSGVQLIFPFTLDNPTLKPSIKMDLTNEQGWQIPAAKKGGQTLLVDQNTITIVGNGVQELTLGTLFLNVGGYNVTIALRTQFDVTKVSPNIIFDITEEERNYLITQTVDRYKEALKAEHDKAMASIDDKAREEALKYVGEVVLSKPKYQAIKREIEESIGSTRVEVFIDEITQYSVFNILTFEIDNPSNRDIEISDISLVAIDEEEVSQHIIGKYSCPARIKRGDVARCTYSTINPIITNAVNYELTISGSDGMGVFKW